MGGGGGGGEEEEGVGCTKKEEKEEEEDPPPPLSVKEKEKMLILLKIRAMKDSFFSAWGNLERSFEYFADCQEVCRYNSVFQATYVCCFGLI